MSFFNNLRAKKALEENPVLITMRDRSKPAFIVPLCDACLHSDMAHANQRGGCDRCECAKFVHSPENFVASPVQSSECKCGHLWQSHSCADCGGLAECTAALCGCLFFRGHTLFELRQTRMLAVTVARGARA